MCPLYVNIHYNSFISLQSSTFFLFLMGPPTSPYLTDIFICTSFLLSHFLVIFWTEILFALIPSTHVHIYKSFCTSYKHVLIFFSILFLNVYKHIVFFIEVFLSFNMKLKLYKYIYIYIFQPFHAIRRKQTH